MSTTPFVQECPTCQGHGIMPLLDGLPEEAVVCPQCQGKGWQAVALKPFTGRPARRQGVTVIKRSRGQCPHPDVARTGQVMTYDDFEKFFPAKRRKNA